MIKALDYQGKVLVTKEPISVAQAWFISKNADVHKNPNELLNYSRVWLAKQVYNCSYEPNIESVVSDMEKRVLLNAK